MLGRARLAGAAGRRGRRSAGARPVSRVVLPVAVGLDPARWLERLPLVARFPVPLLPLVLARAEAPRAADPHVRRSGRRPWALDLRRRRRAGRYVVGRIGWIGGRGGGGDYGRRSRRGRRRRRSGRGGGGGSRSRAVVACDGHQARHDHGSRRYDTRELFHGAMSARCPRRLSRQDCCRGRKKSGAVGSRPRRTSPPGRRAPSCRTRPSPWPLCPSRPRRRRTSR